MGRQTIVGLRWRGYLLGVPSVISGELSPVTAVVLARSVLQRVPAKEFLNLLQTDSDFAWKMHCVHSRELCEQFNSLGELACCPARSRLARHFRRLIAAGEGQMDGKNMRVRLSIKQKEIAELIGVTPEHLNRLLHALSKDGILHLHKGWVVIPKPQALASL
jgi:CRP-like cAMP-binding protein